MESTAPVYVARLNGILLRRQPKGIKADWVQHIVALVSLQPRHNVCEHRLI
jgi:hypothetical protein